MNYCEHVTKAKAGSTRDFAELVELFQVRLDSWLRRWISSGPDREEVLMDCFLLAWQRLPQLRVPEAFPSWLWAIGRTQAWKHLRQADPRLVFGLEVENLASEQDARPGSEQDIASLWETWSLAGTWNQVLGALSQGQREAVELHHLAGFSCRETALICQTTEARVKSRLHEARLSIRRLAGVAQGGTSRTGEPGRRDEPERADGSGTAAWTVDSTRICRSVGNSCTARLPGSADTRQSGVKGKAARPRRVQSSPAHNLKEIIMTRIDTLKLGAHVFERLSLSDQTAFALAVINKTAFGPEVLAALGIADRGREFLALYGGSLGMSELAGILNHCDRFTEGRLVRQLENTRPVEAEALKQRLFVFEDFAICDPGALGLVFARVEAPVILTALAGTTAGLRAHLLGGMDKNRAAEFTARLVEADASLQAVRLAQEELIAAFSDLVETGRLRLTRQEGHDTAVASIHPA